MPSDQKIAQCRLGGFATHLPILAASVAHTTGAVLELGCGAYSTPILHALCSVSGRELVSLEGDPECYEILKRFNRGNHRVQFVPDWSKVEIARPWDVVLVDHAPGLDRIVKIQALKSHARIIIAHDTEHRSYNYEPTFATFKYRIEWRPYSPWATAVSDVDAMEWLKDVARD